MPEKLARILFPSLMAYAIGGFMLSFVLHLLALAGLQPASDTLMLVMFAGIFPLWLPVVFVSMKMLSGLSRSQSLQTLYAEYPKWMRRADRALRVYAIANFVGAIVLIFALPDAMREAGDGPPRAMWFLFSSYGMLFYFAGGAILWVAHSKGISHFQPKCMNGHSATLNDRYCATCGVPIGQPSQ